MLQKILSIVAGMTGKTKYALNILISAFVGVVTSKTTYYFIGPN